MPLEELMEAIDTSVHRVVRHREALQQSGALTRTSAGGTGAPSPGMGHRRPIAGAAFQYCPHIRRIGEEKLDRWGEKTFPARRWVVERTLSWLSKYRAILVRYHKKASNYLGLIQLACALLWYRRQHRLLF